jgi:ribosomal-protein-serine acetyltransferase
VEKKLKKIALPLSIAECTYLDIIQKKDKNIFFNLIDTNRQYLRQGVPWLDQCQTIDQTMLFIERSLQNLNLNQSIRLGIFFTKQLIGAILLTPYWKDQAFEIGYWIDRSFQGRGIVTTSCSSVLEIIYKEFEVKKILIHCTVDNMKSQSVAKHLGFTQQEGSVHRQWLYGQYTNCVWYEKTLP